MVADPPHHSNRATTQIMHPLLDLLAGKFSFPMSFFFAHLYLEIHNWILRPRTLDDEPSASTSRR